MKQRQADYVVVGGKLRAAIGEPPGPAFTADLYRSIEDLGACRVLEPSVRLSASPID